MSVIISLIIFI